METKDFSNETIKQVQMIESMLAVPRPKFGNHMPYLISDRGNRFWRLKQLPQARMQQPDVGASTRKVQMQYTDGMSEGIRLSWMSQWHVYHELNRIQMWLEVGIVFPR